MTIAIVMSIVIMAVLGFAALTVIVEIFEGESLYWGKFTHFPERQEMDTKPVKICDLLLLFLIAEIVFWKASRSAHYVRSWTSIERLSDLLDPFLSNILGAGARSGSRSIDRSTILAVHFQASPIVWTGGRIPEIPNSQD